MISLNEITGFDWDAGNERKSLDKHSVSKLEAEEVFFNVPILLLNDEKHSESEQRFHALGKTDAGRLLHITFTIRANKLRVISARDMHRKEKKVYENNT
jgi:uncharacterized DUF497 family protein